MLDCAAVSTRRMVWLNQYVEQLIPIVGLIALRLVVGAGSWLAAKFGKKKKSKMEEMAEQVPQPL